jgi:demethylmenaquinone methyltransferase/2-methoxy-6-polyprenyl-1,4-benzoquinol methylase
MSEIDIPDMFSRIAPRYDLLNHVLSLNLDRLWRRRLVEAADVRDGARVLDACAGTGDVALAVIERTGAREVVAVDLSCDMIRIGKMKTGGADPGGKVRFVGGDALQLPFATGVFDAVTVAFGLRNLSHYGTGLSEMRRVLAPGGRLVVLEFAPPPRGLRGRTYGFYLRRLVPKIGHIVSGSRNAYGYLASTVGEFLRPEDVLDLMAGAGFRKLSAKSLTGGIVYLYRGDL